ncbi:MAG: UPF0758 domain-containing protein [bacterium]
MNEYKSFTIHDLPISERPRERLQKFGAPTLSAQELLADIKKLFYRFFLCSLWLMFDNTQTGKRR